jgi:nucleoside-diphosphate-sugar epimerase
LKTVLVTGATGFIGPHLVRLLSSQGYSVKCLARKTSNISELSKIAAKICYGDVTEFDTLPRALRGTDVVVHLAAVRGDRPISMNEYRAVNVTGTANLLKSCRVEGVRRFIYCSTVGVMGWIENPPADETCKLRPIGPYHVTKARAEELVREYTGQGVVEGTIVRPGITYGVGDTDGMIFKLTQLLARKRFIWIGNGTNRVHLVATENLTEGFRTIIDNEGSIGGTFIVADSAPITMECLVHTICDALRVDPPILRVPTSLARRLAVAAEKFGMATHARRASMFNAMRVDILTRDRCYDISKARSLGYAPQISTPIGLRRAVEWMRSRQLV